MASRKKPVPSTATTEPSADEALPTVEGEQAVDNPLEHSARPRSRTERAPWGPIIEDDEELDDEEDEEPQPVAVAGRLRRAVDDEDEEDEEEEDDEDEEDTSPVPALTVRNDDPALLSFLTTLSEEPATAFALADWLLEQNDPRADTVRDLAEARAVVPEGVPSRYDRRPMVAARYWCAMRGVGAVTAWAYPGTLLGTLLVSRDYRADGTVRVPRDRQTPERLLAACERCRATLILGLFGTSPQLLRARQVLGAEARQDRIAATLARCGRGAVSLLVDLRSADPGRFDVVMKAIWSRDNLHPIGYAVMDQVKPGWRQQLMSGVATGASPAGSEK
jgi:hypothetical protein